MPAKRKYRGETNAAFKKRRSLSGSAKKKANAAAAKKYRSPTKTITTPKKRAY